MLPAFHAIDADASFCQQPGVFGMKRKCEAVPSNYPVASWEVDENAAKRLRSFYDGSQTMPAYGRDQCIPVAVQQMLHVDVTGHDIALHGELEEKSDACIANFACGRAFQTAIQEEKVHDLMDAEAASQSMTANLDTAACSAMDAEGCPNPAQYGTNGRSDPAAGLSHGSGAGSGAVRRRGYCRPFWDGVLAPYPYFSDIY